MKSRLTVRLSSEESDVIASAMRKHKLSQRHLASRLGTSQPRIAQIMLGRLPMPIELMQGLYDSLGQDPEIGFLKRYLSLADMEQKPKSGLEKDLNSIYEAYLERLRSTFDQSKTKGAIISDLEGVVLKYENIESR